MLNIKIILSTILFAVGYGILHDFITAFMCVEYFTIGHPKVIESDSPVLITLTWGVIATWWLALPMGLLIAWTNHFGKKPSLNFNEVKNLILRLILTMFIMALIAGIVGYTLAKLNVIYLKPHLANRMNPSKHSWFLAAGWAHFSSYLSGVVGVIVVCLRILKKRNSTFLT